MLYLPEENHFGGSSEPAWVASSWVLTPPTQSYPPPLLWLASPPLSRGDGIPGWILPLSELRGRSPTVGVSLFPGCYSRAAVSRDSHRPSEESDVTTKKEKRSFWLVQMSDLPPLFDSSVLMLLETWPSILLKILLLFVHTGSKWEEIVKSSGAPLLASLPLYWLVGSSNPARNGAQRLDGAENFQPIRDAAAQDRSADWEKSEMISEEQNLTINVSKLWKILLEEK